MHFIDVITSKRNCTKWQKSTINRKHGKNENRNDGKSHTKNKPKGNDGKDRTHETYF